MFGSFPETVHKGNGTQQLVIDATATDAQREAIQHIAYNEDTDDLTCHYAVYNAMSTTVYDPVVFPIEIDMERRTAKGLVEGLIESSAEPIRNATTGAEHHAQIVLPNGFEYTVAEMGSGTSTRNPLFLSNSSILTLNSMNYI